MDTKSKSVLFDIYLYLTRYVGSYMIVSVTV
jgi:hypothetical protein